MDTLNLFEWGNFTLNSGKQSNFKIECDALTASDWATIAKLVNQQVRFKEVVGVPRGGMPLARALDIYRDEKASCCLIVDDVLTTGGSMERMKESLVKDGRYIADVIVGAVLFARGEPAGWIYPIFQLESGRARPAFD